MARRHRAEQRAVLPDTKYGHTVLAKFINSSMYCGKKSRAEIITYTALESFASKIGISPIDGFEKVISNVRPLVEVRSRRIGGATYQIPIEVNARRGIARAIRWILAAARSRASSKDMSEGLCAEFIDAYNGRGIAIKKRDDTHKMAEANKAFMHYK